MPAISFFTRSAGRGSSGSSGRACWSSGPAGSAHLFCSILRRRASARWAIVDDDTVSLSNLQRQVIHDSGAVGEPKTASAARAIARTNPHVAVEQHRQRLDPDSAAALIGAYDIVVDGSDNFDTRYLAADTAAELHKPLVTAAVGRFDGSVTVLKPYETGPDGLPNPSYRDLFPSAPAEGTVPTCAEAGIVGALTGVVGSLQAMEVIKLITGQGEPLVGRLLLYDGLAARFDTIRYRAG